MIKPTLGTSGWTDDELTRIGDATELQLASHRPDRGLCARTRRCGSSAPGDDLYVRSAGGPDRPWFIHRDCTVRMP